MTCVTCNGVARVCSRRAARPFAGRRLDLSCGLRFVAVAGVMSDPVVILAPSQPTTGAGWGRPMGREGGAWQWPAGRWPEAAPASDWRLGGTGSDGAGAWPGGTRRRPGMRAIGRGLRRVNQLESVRKLHITVAIMSHKQRSNGSLFRRFSLRDSAAAAFGQIELSNMCLRAVVGSRLERFLRVVVTYWGMQP